MRVCTSMRRYIHRLAIVIGLTSYAGLIPQADGQSLHVVILGSSTAAGANASPLSESWASRFTAWLQTASPDAQVTNLAVGGFTTFNIMPTGNVPPGTWNQSAYLPAPNNNITAALALGPDLIIINLPTNDCDLHVPIAQQIANYTTIVGAAAEDGVPVWICTPQPRTNSDATARIMLATMVGFTNAAFAGWSVDFWTGLNDGTGKILPEYDTDQVHLNNAGHALLFERITATITTAAPANPFVAMHPISRSTDEGDTVSFRVIGAGDEPVTYQWQRNGMDLPGETSPFLWIPAASMTDNAALFRCVVTINSIVAISNEARLTVIPSTNPPSGSIVSDDFSSGILDTSLWKFHNPLSDGSLGFAGAGTDDVRLTIAVPGGVDHDLWTNINTVASILQSIPNQDFEVEVKFATIPLLRYQMQGLLVQRDSANLVRFDVVHQGSKVHVFAATYANGLPTVRKDTIMGGNAPQFLRLKRTGDLWTGSYSFDGTAWITASTFTHATVVVEGGVFAGNAGEGSTPAPAFTAEVDYFFNMDAPIVPEDAPTAPVLVAPVDGSTDEVTSVGLEWSSTGNSVDSVLVAANPNTWSSPLIVAVVPSDSGTLHLDGLMPGATYYWKVRCVRSGAPGAWSAIRHFTTVAASIVLRGSLTESGSVFTPDTCWADSDAIAAGDWAYGTDKVIPVTVRSTTTVTFTACSVMVHWDSALLTWQGLDLGGSVWAGAHASTATIDPSTGTASLTAAFSDTVTLLPAGWLVRPQFSVKRPGRSVVTLGPIRFTRQTGSAAISGTGVADTLTASVLLGDVASAAGITSRGDGRVDFEDLSIWSFGYWSARTDTGAGAGRYRRKYDVGPTADGTPFTLPIPDGNIDFEDLMILARMYGTTESTVLPKSAGKNDGTITVAAGTEVPEGNGTAVAVVLQGSAGDLHGLVLRIPGAADRFIGLRPGALLASLNPSPLIFERKNRGDIEINIVALGSTGHAIPLNGELLTVQMNSSGTITPRIIDARDGQNRPIRTTGQGEATVTVPLVFGLDQNYPNPFNPNSDIRYRISEFSQAKLAVYDVLGREVAVLVNEGKASGAYQVRFDASGLPSGVYFYRLTAGQFTETRRMLVVK